MKQDRLAICIGNVDYKYVEEAENYKKQSRNAWIKWGALAACMCMLVAGVFTLIRPLLMGGSGNTVLQWSNNFPDANYFKFNDDDENSGSSSASSADSVIPYDETRWFSDERKQLEQGDVIPLVLDHPLFECMANYNADGSLFSLIFSWHQRGDEYSDLSVTAGYQEVEMIEDCIAIELDERGNVVTPSVTVTERDGIKIVAQGNKTGKKTLTYQNDGGWYQISGSWNNGYEQMADLLDWFWAHPIDFERFSMDAGDKIEHMSLEKHPDAFAGCIPDFNALGFIEEYTTLTLKNGQPYAFEANYIAHADAKQVKEGNYYDVEGWTNIHWCIITQPDYYELQESLGGLGELTRQMVFDELKDNSNFGFSWNGNQIRVFTNTPQETWEMIESIR